MTIHEISLNSVENPVMAGHWLSAPGCHPCGWHTETWMVTSEGPPQETVRQMLVDWAERMHLSSPLLSGEMVVIAGARLTRRDNSFVGKLGDKRVVIQRHEQGLWTTFFNDTGNQVTGHWVERVSEAVRSAERKTNGKFA